MSTISSQDLYNIFDSIHSIDQRIELLRTIDYNFYQDCQPDAILTWFYDIETQDRANQVAKIFMDRLGDTIICREASCCEKKFLTIMDFIAYEQVFEDPQCPRIIIDAFRNLNFKFAYQCNKMALCRMYSADPAYAKTPLGKFNADYISGSKRNAEYTESFESISKMKRD